MFNTFPENLHKENDYKWSRVSIRSPQRQHQQLLSSNHPKENWNKIETHPEPQVNPVFCESVWFIGFHILTTLTLVLPSGHFDPIQYLKSRPSIKVFFFRDIYATLTLSLLDLSRLMTRIQTGGWKPTFTHRLHQRCIGGVRSGSSWLEVRLIDSWSLQPLAKYLHFLK